MKIQKRIIEKKELEKLQWAQGLGVPIFLKIFTPDQCTEIINTALNTWIVKESVIQEDVVGKQNWVEDLDYRNTTLFSPPKPDDWLCSTILINIKNFNDLNMEIYNFENSISVHENQGATIHANIIENEDSDIYGILCYLEGNNIATSAQFFLTDSVHYFVSGGLEFDSVINPQISPQNNIMKSEIFNFISSFRWSGTDE